MSDAVDLEALLDQWTENARDLTEAAGLPFDVAAFRAGLRQGVEEAIRRGFIDFGGDV